MFRRIHLYKGHAHGTDRDRDYNNDEQKTTTITRLVRIMQPVEINTLRKKALRQHLS